jgi:Ca2+-binding RTX toxin-like protein
LLYLFLDISSLKGKVKLMTTINGTSIDDVLLGTLENDGIAGLEGSDVIFGGAGNDTLNGNQGDDFLFGELGDDQLLVVMEGIYSMGGMVMTWALVVMEMM